MTLTKEDVEKIANLARMALTSEEKTEYQRQLSAVLDYAEMLNELDLKQIDPALHTEARKNVMRADVIERGLLLEDVLFNTAKHAQDQFQIQSVLED
jgi:aspartyl-tRNA(Asn)/glutamyl-tRNA(Gln) amidotransferase subunit C